MLCRSLNLVFLLSMLLGVCASALASTTASIAVAGSEQPGDSNTITVQFNGFIETVRYGQFSTQASIASAFAAMFSRDYLQAGLCAAVASPGSSVINFKLRGGAGFGPLDVTGSTASFSLSGAGFVSQGSTAGPDTGNVVLTVNNSSGVVFSKSTNYGAGATPSSVAEGLSGFDGNVNVTAAGNDLYIQATGTGATTDYSYAISSQSTAGFSSPSFAASPSNGYLTGGASGSGSPQTIYSYSASYDPVGNMTGFNDSSYAGPIMGAWSITDNTGASGYDSLYRLVAAIPTSGPYSGLHLTWSYDNFGNRTSENISGTPAGNVPIPASTIATYNANNQVSSTNLMPNNGPFGYDAAGNVTQDNQNQYLYDAEGRICAVSNMLGGMIGYLYDAEGKRIAKGMIQRMTSCDPTVNGFQLTDSYALDAAGNQMSEYGMDVDGSMRWQHTNVWTASGLLATYDLNGLHFYIDDPLGTRRVQTDYAGVIEQTCSSLPFGDGDSCIPLTTEHLFTGKERDSESGNDYFGARYYASSMGRFLSPDDGTDQRSSNPQSLNRYSYAHNNPLRNIDPYGHSTQTANNGDVLAVYNDGDLGVYQHTDIDNFADWDGSKLDSDDEGTNYMGETERWGEFAQVDKKHPDGIDGSHGKNAFIHFGISIDDQMKGFELVSKGLGKVGTASESRNGGYLDIKSGPLGDHGDLTGYLVNGNYMSIESAGNFLAGYDATKNGDLSPEQAQKVFGAYQQGGFKAAIKAWITGNAYPGTQAPYWGEVPYSGAMQVEGENAGKQ